MGRIQQHLRNTFLAGIFTAIPLVVTLFVIWYIDNKTQPLVNWLPVRIPFLGVIVAIAALYLMGLAVTSLIGQYFLSVIDSVLSKIPLLRELYAAWKQVSLTPGGKEGTYSKVVLVPVETGRAMTIGFTSGEGISGDPDTCCVLVPSVPNPINGRLYFVKRDDLCFLDVSPEEALKVILSTGNYVPEEFGRAMRAVEA